MLQDRMEPLKYPWWMTGELVLRLPVAAKGFSEIRLTHKRGREKEILELVGEERNKTYGKLQTLVWSDFTGRRRIIRLGSPRSFHSGGLWT